MKKKFLALAVFTALMAFLHGCSTTKGEPKRCLRVKPGCELIKLDFGTGTGLQCYCKIEVLEDKTANAKMSYIYMPMAERYCK